MPLAGITVAVAHELVSARRWRLPGHVMITMPILGSFVLSFVAQLDPLAERPGTTVPWAMPGRQKEAMLDPSTAKWLKELRTAELRMPRYHFLQVQ